MLTKQELRALVKGKSAKAFCDENLFSNDAWLFENADELGITGSYDDFRSQFGAQIGVPAKDIAIVGSAKFGFSLSPSPGEGVMPLNKFTDDSDIDTVIVSEDLFSNIWMQFKEAFFNDYQKVLTDHADDLFKGFIVMARDYPYNSKYLRGLSVKMVNVRRELQKTLRIENLISYRIYSSWPDAKRYHTWSTQKLRERLGS